MGREVYWDERQRSEKMKLNLGIFMNPVQKIPIRLGSGGAFSSGGWGYHNICFEYTRGAIISHIVWSCYPERVIGRSIEIDIDIRMNEMKFKYLLFY